MSLCGLGTLSFLPHQQVLQNRLWRELGLPSARRTMSRGHEDSESHSDDSNRERETERERDRETERRHRQDTECHSPSSMIARTLLLSPFVVANKELREEKSLFLTGLFPQQDWSSVQGPIT